MVNPVRELLELTEQMAGHADHATVEQLEKYMKRRYELFTLLELMDDKERLDLMRAFPGQSLQEWDSIIERAMIRFKKEAQDKLVRFQQAKQQRVGYDGAALDTNSFFFDRKK
ncbi:hypothetical protein FE783_23355 [Paenibacillus mesophilus]|uniref:hypothetical protein n=1 Tax=Paenibacillus mesophilus TaxID=2582849 RepID=UPI00110E8DE6|nr:hypothetical protein [Paenibacillus mesophilus]TMV47178.1 hypothetical protein FE783_23355 [Paenibacillus mesophilus]